MDPGQSAPVSDHSNTSIDELSWNEKDSNLTIICHGRHFNVHKAVLCHQSKIVANLCPIDEPMDKIVTIQQDQFDEDIMERIISFAYTKDYRRPGFLPSGQRIKTTAMEQWKIHARVYHVAEYYLMPGLSHLAQERFKQVARDELDDHSDLGDLSNSSDLAREFCKNKTREDGVQHGIHNKDLRNDFLVLVDPYIPKLVSDDGFLAALRKADIEDLAVYVFCSIGQTLLESEGEKRRTISQLKTHNKVLRRALSTTDVGPGNQVASAERIVPPARQTVPFEELTAEPTSAANTNRPTNAPNNDEPGRDF